MNRMGIRSSPGATSSQRQVTRRPIARFNWATSPKAEHVDYHRATDTVDRVDVLGLVRVIDYVERVARVVDR